MRRTRYQNDLLKSKADEVESDSLSAESIKSRNKNGNLRPDPDGNLISSRVGEPVGEMHMPVIDLDVSHVYLPSHTPGHAHLYINKLMSAEDYEKLLTVMVEVGILGKGNLTQFKVSGASYARLPKHFKEQQTIIGGLL